MLCKEEKNEKNDRGRIRDKKKMIKKEMQKLSRIKSRNY